MTRFDYSESDWDYGRWMLWETATQRALEGKRGQAALADLEQALLDLPERRLIESSLARDGEVCAVGALVVANRVKAGEKREEVLADLERKIDPEGDWEAADVTACVGAKYGRMAYAMAWRLAELNDEDCRDLMPERRFEYVLNWVRKAQGKEAIAA